MNRIATVAVAIAAGLSALSPAVAADGLVALKSPHAPAETATRLEAAIKQRNLTLFARIDHAAGAARIGKTLRPTEVLVFGNPQGGTPFMECQQTVGIDLPLKALVWQDAAGQTWLGYNDPAWIAKRHAAPDCPVAPNLGKALGDLMQSVVAP